VGTRAACVHQSGTGVELMWRRDPAGRRSARLSVVGAVALALLAAGAAGVRSPAASASSAGPFLTILFSRTAVTSANACVEDDTGIERLDTVVAPTLYGMGLHPTGTIQTGPTRDSSLWCGHHKRTLYASWKLARQLASQYGWTFASHSSTYPDRQSAWATKNLFTETCGSEQKITSEGLPGAQSLFAWPNNYVYSPALADVEGCFDFNRPNAFTYVSDEASIMQPPYYAPMRAVNGGACADHAAACSTPVSPLAGYHYTQPSKVIGMLDGMSGSQWTILQAYVLVTGSQPGQWDCTSAQPSEHWTDDTERYCWNDYLTILRAIPQGMTVTDASGVASAWGRTPIGPATSLQLSPAAASVKPGVQQPYRAEAFDADGTDLGDVTAQTTFQITAPGSCNGNSCGSAQAGSYTVTATDGNATGTAQLTVGT
jgi:hypothetical protein